MISHLLGLATGTLLVLLVFTCQAHASGDGSGQYDWKFLNSSETDDIATTIIACQPYPLELSISSSYIPVPPFYMVSVDESGKLTPQVDLIGYEASSLRWGPQYPPGTKLRLAVVDSLYTFTPLNHTLYIVLGNFIDPKVTCHTPTPPESSQPPSSKLTLNANSFNDTSRNCSGGVDVRANGGNAPYTFFRIKVDQDALRVQPQSDGVGDSVVLEPYDLAGMKVLFGVNDTNGNWAWTPMTTITKDPLCTSTPAGQNVNQNQHTSQKHSKITPPIIASIVIPIVVVSFMATSVVLIWRCQKRKSRLGGRIPSIDPFFKNPFSPVTAMASRSMLRVRARGKGSNSTSADLESVIPPPATVRDGERELEEIVMQHRDAGAVFVSVTELPPAYVDLQVQVEVGSRLGQDTTIRVGKDSE